MPKLIDYPRTNYTGAWEIAEVVDDTGGKSALETAARKLNRKVSGSFKAIVGSAVKFGLLTSKREMLTTTTLFRRIKHAYDKQEELLFHREAFLTPPLFTQLCRKFRSRELPVAMLDILLIREFEVEEINAQGVAKAFVDGARMVGLLDEHNLMADIDQLTAQQPPRRELASPPTAANAFRQLPTQNISLVPLPSSQPDLDPTEDTPPALAEADNPTTATKRPEATVVTPGGITLPASRPAPVGTSDAIANLFGLTATPSATLISSGKQNDAVSTTEIIPPTPATPTPNNTYSVVTPVGLTSTPTEENLLFVLQLTGPGINTSLEVVDAEDLSLVRALLDKIERQLKRR